MADKTTENVMNYLASVTDQQMCKTLEIMVLHMLQNTNTYFADSFSLDDVEQMERNIKADFPLLHETAIQQKADRVDDDAEIRRDLQERLASRDVELDGLTKVKDVMAQAMTDILYALVESEQDTTARRFFRIDEVVAAKVELGLQLSDDDKAHVMLRLRPTAE